jgi:hypothetical protein
VAITKAARIKLRAYASLPTDYADPGELCVAGGKLFVCTVAGTPATWVVVGIQS